MPSKTTESAYFSLFFVSFLPILYFTLYKVEKIKDKSDTMLKIFSFITILFLITPLLFSQEADSQYDDNTAFYEGEKFNYIIEPPSGFEMNSEESTDDGFSFAFIPKGEKYSEASIVIGINIFKLKKDPKKKFTLDMLINGDTTAVRKHFGKNIEISEVAPIKTLTGDAMRTIYFNTEKGFIPNVMMSYLDGESEILIFDLSISDVTPRFKAEKKYLECLENIKVLTKGTIEVG